MAAAKTEFLEALNDAARKLAAREGISFSVAYGRVLDQNPGAYEAYLRERDSHVVGSSSAKAYLQVAQRLSQNGRALR
jgi:hypothetical protein